ncbi:TetR/AcrR family transcriptional regulator [Duganella sp. HH105]|uniref:TetR/AcrR family transcriptional regulator n=1 Tax=Duganella sp. HH105 TaxID=1781067 RepID=UPI000877AFFB|nr:TetR/AcrR family transcriptional regulator [Duganella sp. HH105]OEZ54023.1 bacterial regulatory protein, tetR family [Duganella sp. HH105]
MAAPAALRLRKAPRQRRAVHTVDALLEAAALVLEADGLEGFNTNAVARRAGASVGSLYQYFPSKEALTLALMLREKRQFYDALLGAVALPDCRDALTRLVDLCARQQLTRPHLARLLDQEEARPEFRAALSDGSSFRSMLASILGKPGAPPHLCDDEPRRRLAADDLAALIRGMTDAAGERGERDVEDLAYRIGAAVFGYLAAPPRQM